MIQNNQKIELYGSLTTKELKKSHSSRQIGGAEMQRDAESPRDVNKNGEVQRGMETQRDRTSGPILMCDGYKMGRIPWE